MTGLPTISNEMRALLELMERSDVMVSIKDARSGRYVHAGNKFARLMACTPGGMVGRLDADLLDAVQAGVLRAADQTALAHHDVQWSEHHLQRDGHRCDFSVNRQVLPAEPGKESDLLVSVWVDVTTHREHEARLHAALSQIEHQQAALEGLQRERREPGAPARPTELFQRQHFEDQLRREVDLSSREHREFALVEIVVDPLTPEAAAMGDEAQARVLEVLARLLRENTRAMDALCHIEQTRFAVLLSGVGLATAHSRMEGLRRQCVTQIVALDGHQLGFTVSMGVASFPHTASSQEELQQAVDKARREATRRGGNHVTLASIRFEPH